MERLVECVPNFSDASDVRLLDDITACMQSAPGAWLLDRTSDVDHARSVFTLAGGAAAIRSAMEASAALAIDRIDLRAHAGQHPRIGAVDVVPFVPLGETSMDDCVGLARDFAASLAERHDLPVYLYGKAAMRPERSVLADIRRPRFEGLNEAMAQPGGEPDYGPARPHPTAGATAVGVRPFLIAYNIQLDGGDVGTARRIAAQVRQRGGGLPGVQALGLELPSQGCVQVSMNVLDYETTPLWEVWERVTELAAQDGVAVLDSELIGLAPMAAFEQVADHIAAPIALGGEARVASAARWLRIRDFHREMVLELRLAKLRSEP